MLANSKKTKQGILQVKSKAIKSITTIIVTIDTVLLGSFVCAFANHHGERFTVTNEAVNEKRVVDLHLSFVVGFDALAYNCIDTTLRLIASPNLRTGKCQYGDDKH
jgi:hypothetical protein